MKQRRLNSIRRALWNPKFIHSIGKKDNKQNRVQGFSWRLLAYRETVMSALVLVPCLPILGIILGIRGSAGFMVGFLVVYICFTMGVATALGADWDSSGFACKLCGEGVTHGDGAFTSTYARGT